MIQDPETPNSFFLYFLTFIMGQKEEEEFHKIWLVADPFVLIFVLKNYSVWKDVD